MKTLYALLLALSVHLLTGGNMLYAQDKTGTGSKEKQTKHAQKFVDKNGDGYNDNAPDHDGDGIPDGLDPDWQKQQRDKKNHKFIDLNGDGINDYMQGNSNKKQMHQKGQKQMKRSGNAAGDQTSQQHHGQMKRHGGGH